jgi:hypothetical protein
MYAVSTFDNIICIVLLVVESNSKWNLYLPFGDHFKYNFIFEAKIKEYCEQFGLNDNIFFVDVKIWKRIYYILQILIFNFFGSKRQRSNW